MAEGQAVLRVSLVCSVRRGTVQEWTLDLPSGSSVQQALDASCLAQEAPEALAAVASGTWALAVWGRPASPQTLLRADDRIELCRPLLVDPKVARRERFQKQGERRAGLFAHRPPGRKAGY